MKKLLFAATLFAQTVFAAPVTINSTGKGETQDEAYRQAKIIAIEGATGSFNLGHRSLRDNKYREEIDDYVSGIIIESKIIDSRKEDGLWVVKASSLVDIDKQSTFERQRDKPLFDDHVKNKISEMNNRKEIMEKMDGRGQMMYLADEKVYVQPYHQSTVVAIQGYVKWQRKWVEDFEKFVLYAGNMNVAKKTYESNVYMPMSYAHPVFAVGHILANPSESETRPGYAYCFAQLNSSLNGQRCANLGYEMSNFPKFHTIKATIVLKDSEGRVLAKSDHTKFDVKMSEFASAGTSKKEGFLFFSNSHYFKTNTSIILTDAAVPVKFDFVVPNELASKVNSYSVIIN